MNRDFHQRGLLLGRAWTAGMVATCMWWLPCIIFVASSSASFGQEGLVQIEIDPSNDIGVGGVVRPGTWTPMRVTIQNNTPQVRTVNVEWIVPDVDGDDAILQRTPVPLNPNGKTSRWLYAVPTIGSNIDAGWLVRCVDTESGETLASKRVAPSPPVSTGSGVAPPPYLPPKVGVVGVTGSGSMGLDRYRPDQMQHEQLYIVKNIVPTRMPDQWHGLSILDTLVWTPDGGDPTDPAVAGALRAVRDWVWRGGHLIVVLSSVDVAWSDPKSKLADMLPPVTIKQAEIAAPQWLYPADQAQFMVNVKFSVKTFEPSESAGRLRPVEFLQPDPSRPAQPLIAASPYGFGRVTLVGIDVTDSRFLTDIRFIEHGLPRFWTRVVGWQNPAFLPKGFPPFQQLAKDNRVFDEISRERQDLPRFIAGEVAMKQTAATTLVAAILLFAVYWLLAGPVMYAALKARGLLRHSWLIFGGIVVVFSVISWSGAVLLRPGRVNTVHFSVVDIDTTQSLAGNIRTQSWFSIFVPKHGSSSIKIEPGLDKSNINLLASPGLPGSDKGSFSGTQNYVVNAIEPGTINAVPMRSTAKQFQAFYADRIAGSPLEKAWGPPTGTISLKSRTWRRKPTDFPTGSLTHNLPGSLQNITICYCPGSKDDDVAYVWRNSLEWQAGSAYSIAPGLNIQVLVEPPANALMAARNNAGVTKVKDLVTGYENRTRLMKTGEGYLGEILSRSAGSDYERINVLSFFNYLPPPDFVKNPKLNQGFGAGGPTHFVRSIGRSLDLSHMVPLRRLIIIGHMRDDGPIPLPIKVDGDDVNSQGWTVVRFILPISEGE